MTEEIIARLRSLDLSDGGSHSRLSAIASCFLEPAFGWTRGACEELRNMLVKTLEDKDGNDANDHSDGCNCNHHCCDQRQMSYDELGNERHKAVRRLRKLDGYSSLAHNFREALAAAIDVPRDGAPYDDKQLCHLICDRLIHLLGGDQPTLSDLYGIWQDGEESENKGSESAHKMTKSAEIAKPESEDGGENCRTTDEKLNGESLIESLVKNTEELSRQGKVKFPPNEDGSLDSLKTVEEAEALIEDVKRRADQSHDSSPMRQENETRITDELRKWASDNTIKDMVLTTYPEQHGVHGILEQLIAIADRIDTQFDRICEQQEKVLQDTIDYMTEFREHDAEYALTERKILQRRIDVLTAKMELDYAPREKLDEATHDVEMWRDRAEDMRMERDELQQTIDEMVTELDSARAKNCRLSKKWREKCEAMKAERDELQEKNRHLAQKCDEMLVLLSNRAMNAKSDQERRIEKLVRQRDELRVKLKEIGDIANG